MEHRRLAHPQQALNRGGEIENQLTNADPLLLTFHTGQDRNSHQGHLLVAEVSHTLWTTQLRGKKAPWNIVLGKSQELARFTCENGQTMELDLALDASVVLKVMLGVENARFGGLMPIALKARRAARRCDPLSAWIAIPMGLYAMNHESPGSPTDPVALRARGCVEVPWTSRVVVMAP